MKHISKLVILFLLCSGHAAYAQTDVVAHVKSDLVSRGVNLSGTCGAFEVTKRVAWTLRAQGWGLIAKASGDQCQGFAGDKLVSTTGRFVDILIDQGGANSPSWQERAASPEEMAARVEPADPGDGPVVIVPPPVVQPPPVVVPPSVFVVDYDRITAIVQAEGAVILAAVDKPGWLTRFLSNKYVLMVETAVVSWLTTRQLLKP